MNIKPNIPVVTFDAVSKKNSLKNYLLPKVITPLDYSK
ncbi:hypothetical protein CNEO_43988 [Clostridium neonatale]|uniref:Uncharacterized protein n=1 Tax=Clostridium neonatale TaxID=137838 RepID=A0AA86JRF9_9CLOT|nr:hypothetical protein CNEO_43988 [Clostridium neonatale]